MSVVAEPAAGEQRHDQAGNHHPQHGQRPEPIRIDPEQRRGERNASRLRPCCSSSVNTGTNAADSAACENRLLNRFGICDASVNADAAAEVAKKPPATTSRPRPATRDTAVATAKIAVLTAIRLRRGGGGANSGSLATGGVLDAVTGRAIVRTRQRGTPRPNFVRLMANIHSQKKRILRAERERLENRRYTSKIKTYFRRLERAVAGDDQTTADAEHRTLVQTIDKAVKRGALHRNTGARKKSRRRAARSAARAAAQTLSPAPSWRAD